MVILRKVFSFLGWGAQREILSRTLGKSLRDGRLKSFLSETMNSFLWACNVLGDRCFPGLQCKRFLGKVQIGALIVMLTASIIPVALTVRAGYRLANMEWVRVWNEENIRERHLQSIERNRQITENDNQAAEGKSNQSENNGNNNSIQGERSYESTDASNK